VEVLDLRTLAPLDKDAILHSVKKTGRLVIAQEAWKIGGMGGEISAVVSEEGFEYLQAPIIRVGAPHVPTPYSMPFEKMFFPDEQKITDAIRKVLAK